MLRRLALAFIIVCSAAFGPFQPLGPRPATADSTAQSLPYAQNWSTTGGLITANDNWSGVPGVIGYLGDTDSGAVTNVNAGTVLTDGSGVAVDVIANVGTNITNTAGGVGEFDGLADPVVALQGSGTADAPYLLFNLDTTGWEYIRVAYDVRDIDTTSDNAVQQVALHYRVGSSGLFTNVPAAYLADTTVQSATLTTTVVVTLPAAVDNQALIQIRMLTTNAGGSDEWVGIDNVSVTGQPVGTIPDLNVDKAGPATATAGNTITYTLTFSNTGSGAAGGTLLTDTLSAGATLLTYTTSVSHTFTPLSDNQWQWDLGSLPALTAGQVITVQALVSATLPDATVLTNTLSATTSGTELDLSDNAETISTTVGNLGPQLFVLKTSSGLAAAGEPFTYTLVYGNSGDATAAGVLLTDTLPAGFGAGAIITDSSGLTPTDGADTRTWPVGALAAGSRVTFTLAVNVPLTVTGGALFTNTATISTTTFGDSAGDNVSQAAANSYPLVTIAQIQTVVSPTVNGASTYAGQTVWVEGIVTAERGDFDTGNRSMAIEQPGGGPWSGLHIFRDAPSLPTVPPSPPGAHVRILGLVSEFNGLTELNLNGTYAYEVLSVGNPVPGPDVLATGDFIDAATAEQWESVFIRFENATVDNPNIGNGEWTFDDGSGATTGDDLGDVDGDLAYVPAAGDFYNFIQGIGYFSFSAYKLEPLSDADIGLLVTAPSIVKTAPVLVAPGSLFTYTLTVTNQLGITLTALVITDVVPVSTTFAYANNGGVLVGSTVSWTVASLADGANTSVSFAVTATTSATTLNNSQYQVQAGNYVTPGIGSAYRTAVGNNLSIRDIQGAGHRSQFAGQVVTGLVGVVTAVDNVGYYIQDPNPDADNATSEAIFVDQNNSGRTIGELIVISGTVSEGYPGGSGAGGLAVTQLDPPFTLVISSTGNLLPDPIVIGSGGRTPPNMVIDDDATGNVETSGSFDADSDGLDFWESLEGMRVQLNNAIVVAGTRGAGEMAVVPDAGAVGGPISPRGTIVLRENDGNPERIIIASSLLAAPVVNAGAFYTMPIVGVVDYSGGSFKLQATTLPAVNPGTLVSETTALTPTVGQLTIATFNVENLDPFDPPAKFAALADRIVNHLRSPDIIAVEEMQDNNGAVGNDGTVDASTTFSMLITAIQTAGGPTYDYRQINPVNNQDGGEVPGNIRVGFLFRTDRGVSFIDRPGATSTTANSVVMGPDGPQLTYSPGRINPGSSAFNSSRKPLAGEFLFNGAKLFVIANHWNSKGGDNSQNGRFQPPVLSSQVQRLLQATEVHNFVASILALDPDANIVALGDLNDFQWSPPLATVMASGVLTTLINTLPENERYSYVFDGNAQVLDHILVSANLFENAFVAFDAVHVNSEFTEALQASDHDPSLALLAPTPGDLSGSSKTVSAISVTAGSLLTYTLTISNSGGSSVMFALTDTLNANLTLISAPGLSGTTTLTATGLLAVNSQQLYTITVQTSGAFSGTITNTAYLSGGGAYTLTAPAVSVTTPPGLAPNLSGSTKSVNATSVAAGDLLTYTLTISNSGSAAVTFALTDTLDANLTLISAPGLSGTSTLTAGGLLAANAQQTYVITVRVSPTYAGPLNNSASLSGDGQTRLLVASTVSVAAHYWFWLPLMRKP